MKKIKKFLSLFCTLTLAASFLFCYSNASASSEEYLDLDLIKNNISVNVFHQIQEVITDDSNNYVPEYAGAYIDSTGSLHVQFVKGKTEKYKKVITSDMISSSIANEPEAKRLSSEMQKIVSNNLVQVEEQNFSYNDLMQLKSILSNQFGNREICVSLRQETNSIEFQSTSQETLDEAENYLKEKFSIYQDGMVKFILNKNCIAVAASSAYPGNALNRLDGYTYSGTIGFNAYYNGKWGIITNAHVAPLGKIMTYNGVTLGSSSFTAKGGKLDIAFIPYPSGWSPTSSLRNPSYGEVIYREATASEMIEGGLVIKYGATTGKTVNGRITSISSDRSIYYRETNTYVTLHDLFLFSNETIEGDSGGPVGRGGTKQVFRLLGITVASAGDGSGAGIKLSNIKAAYPSMVVKTGN